MQIERNHIIFHDYSKLEFISKKEDFIFYIDKNGKILEIISPLEAVGGYFTIDDIFPDSYQQYFLDSLTEALNYNKLKNFNYELIIENRSRFFEMSIIPVANELAIIILRDISTQKKSMTYLRLIKKICEKTNDGILILSKEKNYIKANDSFFRILGLTKNNLLNYKDLYLLDKEIIKAIESKENIYRKKLKVNQDISIWLSVNSIYNEESNESYKVVIITDISEIEKSRKKLQYIASFDELTSLPNRRLLFKFLQKAIDEAIAKKQVGAVLFLDLDDFKIINDTMGHQTGDIILRESALRVKKLIKKGDIFGRIGGDEFLIVVRSLSRVDLLFKLAQSIIDSLNQPFEIDGIKHYIGASIGISLFPYDSKDYKKLVKFSDMAMYKSKELGKNRYHFYSLELDFSVKRKAFIEKVLRYALKNDGFYLEFQPQVNVSTNAVIGFESLIRIKSKIARDISPREFIKVAQESNLIFEIGKWTIQRSIQQLYIWKQFYNIKKISISINLSKRELLNDDLALFVDKVLTQFNIKPSWIEFEVTENVILNSSDRVIRNIKRLKDMGCCISIDDFGTGSLSLNTFKDKIVDKIKIDKSYIDDLITNKDCRDIVKASITMAKMMGLSIIAEGVEKEEQKRILSILGCNSIQGYFFSKPLRPDAVLPYVVLDKRLKREYFT